MENVKAIWTIGISGCGKTSWAHAQEDYLVLDSDSIREELYGDAAIQTNPAKIFDLMYKHGIAALKNGQNVIFCATNLGMKHRIHALQMIKKQVPNVICRAVVFNTTLEQCKINNGLRARQVPDYVFEKQIKQFQPPVENEGWDYISIHDWHDDTEDMVLKADYWAEAQQKIGRIIESFGSQHNSHHSLSLLEHCNLAGKLAFSYHYAKSVMQAAFIHDYGKAFTATQWPEKDNDYHYPNHAEYGAYLAMNMGFDIKVIALVAYHMVFYMDSAAQVTWRKRLGEKLWSKLEQLHRCDMEAH